MINVGQEGAVVGGVGEVTIAVQEDGLAVKVMLNYFSSVIFDQVNMN